MPEYGEIRVDYITYTTGTSPNEGQGTVTVSGLINNPTFSGNVIIANDLTVSGKGIFASGTESTPSITFIDDLNTGIYSPAANELAISTSGTGRLFIDDSGNVGIGTSSPVAGLHIVSSGQTVSNLDTSSNINALVTDNGLQVGNGGSLVFGAASGSWRFAAIKGIVQNGSNNSRGDLAFSTRRNTTDSTLSESMRIDFNGNVGIGTSNPTDALNISSGANQIGLDTGDQTTYGTLDVGHFANGAFIGTQTGTNNAADILRLGTNGTEKMRITSNGNVGINNINPQAKLSIIGPDQTSTNLDTSLINVRIRSNNGLSGSGGTLGFGVNVREPFAAINSIFRNGNSNGIGDLAFNLRPNISATTLDEVMRITFDSKVGIGTSSPVCKLSTSIANTTAYATSLPTSLGLPDGTEVASLANDDTSSANFKYALQAFVIGAGTGQSNAFGRFGLIRTGNSQQAFVWQLRNLGGAGNTATQEAMRIDSNGNVGIGTSDPKGLLDVRKDNATGEGGTIAIRNTGSGIGTSASLYLTPNNGGGDDLVRSAAIKSRQTLLGNYADLGFFTANSDTPVERMTIAPNGNVGINAISPGYALTVGSASPTFGRVAQFNSSTADSLIAFGTSGGTGENVAEIGADTSDLVVNTQNTERMRIASNGNVGIGTSTPQVALDLDGQTNTTFTQGFNVRLTDNRTAAQGVGAGIGFRGKWNTASPTAVADFAVITGIKENNTDGNYAGALVFGTRTAGTGAVNTERMRIDSSGRLLVGIATATDVAGNFGSTSGSNIQVVANSSFAAYSAISKKNDTSGPLLALASSRSDAIVQADDRLGEIRFAGYDGTDYQTNAALIKVEVDGTPGANDMPGRLVFATTADGASSPTVRMVIKSSGNVGIGTVDPGADLEIKSSANTELRISDTAGGYGSLTYNESGTVSIFNIAADPANTSTPSTAMTFGVDGSEWMRITSIGKLLVGTSSERTLAFGIIPKIQVEGVNSVGDSSLSLTANRSIDELSARLVLTKTRGSSLGSNTIVQDNDELGAIYFCGADGTAADLRGALIQAFVDGTPGTNDMPGRLVFSTTADGASFSTQRMVIKSSGNVGIGTIDPRVALQVNGGDVTLVTGALGTSNSTLDIVSDTKTNNGADARPGLVLRGPYSNGSDRFSLAAIYGLKESTGQGAQSSSLVFATNTSSPLGVEEKMRINSAGNVLVGSTTTTISGLYKLQVVGERGLVAKATGGGGNPPITVWNNENTNDATFIDFRTDTVDASRGSITYDRSAGLVSYNTTSDYRAKTLHENLQNASATVNLLNVYRGTMHGATKSRPMMVAHEVQEIAPYCVTGEKDAVDGNGDPIYQSIDHSPLVPLLTAALQEALAKIEALEQRLADAGL